MNKRILLQAQYANAVYMTERYAREAEIAKALLDALAQEEAEACFSRSPESSGNAGGEDK